MNNMSLNRKYDKCFECGALNTLCPISTIAVGDEPVYKCLHCNKQFRQSTLDGLIDEYVQESKSTYFHEREYDDYEPNPNAYCPGCGRRNVSEYHMANCEGDYFIGEFDEDMDDDDELNEELAERGSQDDLLDRRLYHDNEEYSKLLKETGKRY